MGHRQDRHNSSILLTAPLGRFPNMHCTLTSIEPAVFVTGHHTVCPTAESCLKHTVKHLAIEAVLNQRATQY